MKQAKSQRRRYQRMRRFMAVELPGVITRAMVRVCEDAMRKSMGFSEDDWREPPSKLG